MLLSQKFKGKYFVSVAGSLGFASLSGSTGLLYAARFSLVSYLRNELHAVCSSATCLLSHEAVRQPCQCTVLVLLYAKFVQIC